MTWGAGVGTMPGAFVDANAIDRADFEHEYRGCFEGLRRWADDDLKFGPDCYHNQTVDRCFRLWQRQRLSANIHRAQALHAEEMRERVMQVLYRIHALLPPPPMASGGKTYRFVDPNANATLQELGARIRAIPDELNRP